MNPFALAALVTGVLLGLSLCWSAAARLLDSALAAPERALVVGTAFCAGFCLAVLIFFFRT